MPVLPSGRDVAVDPAPLRNLLTDAASAFNAHHVMGLQAVDDLFRWLDVLMLVRADSVTADELARAQPAPDGAPVGLVAVPAGARLADWHAVACNWSDADRTAFATFVAERIRPAMQRVLDNDVRPVQAALVKTPTLAGAFAAMWKDGVHPLQDEDED
jgi:hypothetical protein